MKKHFKSRRAISSLLVVIMLLCTMPFGISATADESTTPEPIVSYFCSNEAVRTDFELVNSSGTVLFTDDTLPKQTNVGPQYEGGGSASPVAGVDMGVWPYVYPQANNRIKFTVNIPKDGLYSVAIGSTYHDSATYLLDGTSNYLIDGVKIPSGTENVMNEGTYLKAGEHTLQLWNSGSNRFHSVTLTYVGEGEAPTEEPTEESTEEPTEEPTEKPVVGENNGMSVLLTSASMSENNYTSETTPSSNYVCLENGKKITTQLKVYEDGYYDLYMNAMFIVDSSELSSIIIDGTEYGGTDVGKPAYTQNSQYTNNIFAYLGNEAYYNHVTVVSNISLTKGTHTIDVKGAGSYGICLKELGFIAHNQVRETDYVESHSKTSTGVSLTIDSHTNGNYSFYNLTTGDEINMSNAAIYDQTCGVARISTSNTLKFTLTPPEAGYYDFYINSYGFNAAGGLKEGIIDGVTYAISEGLPAKANQNYAKYRERYEEVVIAERVYLTAEEHTFIVKGDGNAFANYAGIRKSDAFEVKSVKTADGEAITTSNIGSLTDIKLVTAKYPWESKTGTFIVAFYNGNRLISTATASATVSGSMGEINIELTESPQGATRLKCFVWDGLSAMSPLSSVFEQAIE